MAAGTQSRGQQTSHTEEVICPYCRRRFDNREDLTFHVVTRHTQSDFDIQAHLGGSK